MNKKQTAVEWLEEELKNNLKHIVLNADGDMIDKMFKQAMQMEKNQIMDAIICNQNGLLRRKNILEAEQYYKETYE